MEPIDVIGLDLKFPGDATDADGFWDMLVTGRSACTDIPDDRFKVSSFYHPDPERSGSVSIPFLLLCLVKYTTDQYGSSMLPRHIS